MSEDDQTEDPYSLALARAAHCCRTIQSIDANDCCKIVGEKNRVTSCTCLAEQLRSNQENATCAIAHYFVTLAGKRKLETRQAFAQAHYVFAANGINQKNACMFSLHVPVGRGGIEGATFGSGEVHPPVVFCRSTMVRLTKLFLEQGWDESISIYPSQREMLKKVKKVRLFQVLFFLIQYGYEQEVGGSISWRKAGFLRLGMDSNSAKKLCDEYNLRELCGMFLRVDQHKSWLWEFLGGSVFSLKKEWMDQAIPLIITRGQSNTNWKSVGRQSLWELADFIPSGDGIATRSRPIQYRPIDMNNQRNDKQTAIMIQRLHVQFAKAIAYTIADREKSHQNPAEDRRSKKDTLQDLIRNLTVDSSFLRTPDYAPQKPHLDFSNTVLEHSKNNGRLFLAFTPLSELGTVLQVWVGGEPQLLLVPYGKVLILPGDTVHGGGFKIDFRSEDLRLHFYLYVKPAARVNVQENVYQSELEYPMHEELWRHQKIWRAFQCDKGKYEDSIPLRRNMT